MGDGQNSVVSCNGMRRQASLCGVEAGDYGGR